MRRWLLWGMVFLAVFVVSLPKERLFWLLQSRFEPLSVEAAVTDRYGWLELRNGEIYWKELELARFEQARLYPYILLNVASLQKLVSPFLPQLRFERLYGFFTPLYPAKIFLRFETSQGEGWGYVELKDPKIVLYLRSERPPNLGALPAKVSKEEEGYRVKIDLGR